MKQLIITFLIFSSIISYGQKKIIPSKVDSLAYYRSELIKLQTSVYDSLRKTKEFDNLYNGFYRHVGKKSSSFSLDLFFDYAKTDYKNLNYYNQLSGFKSFGNFDLRIGFGMTFNYNKWVYNLNAFAIGFNKNSKIKTTSLKANNVDVLQFNVGRVILNSNSFSIYPYFGPSFRGAYIYYVSPMVTSSQFTNYQTFVLNNDSFSASKTNLQFHLGLALDLKIPALTSQKTEKYLYFKIEGNKPVGKNEYNESTIPITINESKFIVTTGIRVKYI